MMKTRQSTAPPVREGDEVEVKIESVGEKGDGVAKVKGFVIFVPNGKKDEQYKVRITRVLRNVGFGEIIGKSEQAEEAKPEPEPVYEDTEDFGNDDQQAQ